jgi:hypothetical protein
MVSRLIGFIQVCSFRNGSLKKSGRFFIMFFQARITINVKYSESCTVTFIIFIPS